MATTTYLRYEHYVKGEGPPQGPGVGGGPRRQATAENLAVIAVIALPELVVFCGWIFF